MDDNRLQGGSESFRPSPIPVKESARADSPLVRATGDHAPRTVTNDKGDKALPIQWTNKTCADWAPISVHHIRLTRQRMQREKIPQIHNQPARPGKFLLIGSSPYVRNHIEDIRELAEPVDNVVFAINSAVNICLENNIRLDGSVLFEGGPDNHVRRFKLPSPESPEGAHLTFYMASWCHPHQWGALRDYKRVIWHGWNEVQACMDEYMKFPPFVTRMDHTYSIRGATPYDEVEDRGIIGGGSTTFSRSVNIGFVLGYRDFELFGFDSSFESDGSDHDASHYVMSDLGRSLPTIDVTPTVGPTKGPTFYCKAFMARQAYEFIHMLGSNTPGASRNPWLAIPNRVRMHGPGMLPWMHRQVFPQHYEAK